MPLSAPPALGQEEQPVEAVLPEDAPWPPPERTPLPLYGGPRAAPELEEAAPTVGQPDSVGALLPRVGLSARTLSRRVQEGLRRLGSGSPIPQGPRKFLERLLGHRLESVRLHSGPEAAAVVGEIGASAATLGPHIMLSSAHTDLGSPRGLALLAHEAVHTIQAARGGLPEEGAPDARRQELQALRAEEAVRRSLAPPGPGPIDWVSAPGPLTLEASRPTAPMPLWRPAAGTAGGGGPGEAFSAKQGVASSVWSSATQPQAVRAVPTAGPIQRAVGESPPEAAAETPAEGQQAETPDLEKLAEEVYRLILYRLNLEREWRGFH